MTVAAVASADVSHSYLVRCAATSLKRKRRCALVVAEPAAQNLEEQPDAIGWQLHGRGSILVECKTTFSDFNADRQKHFRRHPLLGMGRERYYLTPKGLVDPNWRRGFLENWGLLELHGRRVVEVEPPVLFDHAASAYAEQRLLIALVRRREGIMPGCAVFAEQIEHEE